MDNFNDFLPMDDFLIEPDDLEREVSENEAFDTGKPSDIFATGEPQDIFSTI